jgi:magnesium transporter
MAVAYLYDADGHDQPVNLTQIDFGSIAESQLVWLDLTHEELQSAPNLPIIASDLAVRRADDFEISVADGSYAFRFGIPRTDGGTQDMFVAVGPSWVITAEPQRPDLFDQFIESDWGETIKGNLTSTAFAASLLTRFFDATHIETAEIEARVDKLDELILRSREKSAPLAQLATLRHRLAVIRQRLAPQRSIVYAMGRPDFQTELTAQDHETLAELRGSADRLDDEVARARESIIGSFELYAARVGHDTNRLLKALTIVTVVTGVVGAVGGVFGMNFETPFPHTGLLGFGIVTAGSLLLSLAVVAWVMLRKWA